jgi:hypothetical protein
MLLTEPSRAMTANETRLLGAYLVFLNLSSLSCLFLIWPGMKEILPRAAINPPDEIRFLLISTVAGALGSGVILLVSFVDFVGNRMLISSWGWWYVTRPVVGMTVGLFVYIAIRGGILKTGSDVHVDVLNPYTVATIAVLGGAFSNHILNRLRAFAERQFGTPPDRLAPRKDSLQIPERERDSQQ